VRLLKKHFPQLLARLDLTFREGFAKGELSADLVAPK
jgi:hypothetical protein